MYKVETAIYSQSDRFLNSLGLEPWFSYNIFDGAMGSKEGEKGAKLISGDPHVLSGHSKVGGYISTSKRMPCIAVLQNHKHSSFSFWSDCSIISSPVGSKLLWPQKPASCQHKRPQSALISL